MHTLNTRDIWLDGLSRKTEIVLKYLNRKPSLNRKEKELMDLCAGFIYLMGVCEAEDFFAKPDTELFDNVTIH